LLFQLVDCCRDGTLIKRDQLLSVGADAPLYFHAPCPRGEPTGGLGFEPEIVHLATHLPPDLENVAKACGGNDADTSTLAFDDGVGRHRCAVCKTHDLVGAGARAT